MTVLPKQLKQPPAPSSFVDKKLPEPAKNPDPWPFEHGQTYADHAGNVYRAFVTDWGIILRDLNKSAIWLHNGLETGFIEGYFWKPGKLLQYGKCNLDNDRWNAPVITWPIELFPSGNISDFYSCLIEKKVVILED